MWFRRFARELHRRSVWQIGGVFIAAAWVALQVAELLTESAGLPEWFPAFALGLLVLGLPFVLVTAFMQEGLPADEANRRDGDAVAPGREPVPGGLGRLFTWRNAVLGGVGALVVTVAVGAGWWGLAGGSPTPEDDAPQRSSIAVLPFRLVGSSEPDDESFAYGMHDELLTRLSQLGDLRVTSRTSVVQYATEQKPIREIGRELGVETVLEGGIQRSGERVRINVQLIDASTDEHLWAETYDRPFEDIFDLQAELTREVAEALSATLTPDEAARVDALPTEDLAAYELVLEANRLSDLDRDENEAAIGLLKRAVARDPEYGGAVNSLAWRYAYRAGAHGFSAIWLDSALVLARAAEALGAETDARNTIGWVRWLQADFVGARDAWRRAVELAPSRAAFLTNLAHAESQLGEVRQALPHAWRAVLVDPRSPFSWWSVAIAEYTLGRDERAGGYLDQALVAEPGFYWVSFWTGFYGVGDPAREAAAVEALQDADPGGLAALMTEARTHLRYGRRAEAARAARRLRERHPNGRTPLGTAQGTSALVLALAGRQAEAEPLLRALVRDMDASGSAAQVQPLVLVELAGAQLLLDRRADAIATLRALADAGTLFPGIWMGEPALEGLRSDPEFIALAEGVRRRAAEEARLADAAIAGLDPLPGVTDPR